MARLPMIITGAAIVLALLHPSAAGGCEPGSPPDATLRITVDNVIGGLYINGTPVEVGPETSINWTLTDTVTFPVQPGGNVLAVKAVDQGVIAGLLAELRVGDSVLDSGEAWRVHHDAPEGWERPDFDDSSWSAATPYGTHPGGVWGTRVQGMDGSNATWIWNQVNIQDGEVEPTVYFRFTFQVKPGWIASP